MSLVKRHLIALFHSDRSLMQQVENGLQSCVKSAANVPRSASLQQAVQEAATVCPRPLQVDLRPFDLESGSVVFSRPWSRDSSALEFILSRSRSPDLMAKVSVLVSRPRIGLGLKTACLLHTPVARLP